MEYKINSITTRTNELFLPLLVNNAKLILFELGYDKGILEDIEAILRHRFESAYSSVGELTMEYFVSNERLTISIHDKGLPYHLEEIPSNLDYRHEILGLDGQRLLIELKHKSKLNIEGMIKPSAHPEELLDKQITIRPVDPNNYEVIEVIKCIYSAYGYGYGYQVLYNPEQLAQLLQTGKYVSLVAVNEHSQILGHAALSEGFEKLPEVSNVVTKPFCRGLSIAQRICEQVMQTAKERDANGVMIQPVAFHPFTQKLALSQDYTPTGYLFHYINKESAGVYQDNDRRLDVAVAVKLFENTARKIIFPMEHTGFISRIYEKLNVAYELISDVPPNTNGSYTQTFYKEMSISKIVIDVCPVNYSQIFTQMMIECIKKKSEMVEIYINMQDHAAIYAYRFFTKLYAIFTGIVPGSKNGDYLLMQHRMGLPIDFDKILAIEEFSDVLAYIKECINNENF